MTDREEDLDHQHPELVTSISASAGSRIRPLGQCSYQVNVDQIGTLVVQHDPVTAEVAPDTQCANCHAPFVMATLL